MEKIKLLNVKTPNHYTIIFKVVAYYSALQPNQNELRKVRMLAAESSNVNGLFKSVVAVLDCDDETVLF